MRPMTRLGAILALFFCVGSLSAVPALADPHHLLIKGKGHKALKYTIEIADTEEERELGLMYRRNLGSDRGMLFEFEDNAPRAFWMKNTYIPLDIIFIDEQGRIVSIQKNAKPFDQTPLPSFARAKAALEIEGGLSDKLGIEPGDQVIHAFFNQDDEAH